MEKEGRKTIFEWPFFNKLDCFEDCMDYNQVPLMGLVDKGYTYQDIDFHCKKECFTSGEIKMESWKKLNEERSKRIVEEAAKELEKARKEAEEKADSVQEKRN